MGKREKRIKKALLEKRKIRLAKRKEDRAARKRIPQKRIRK